MGFSRLILSIFSTLSITVNAMGILFKPGMSYQNKIHTNVPRVTRLFMRQAEIPTSHAIINLVNTTISIESKVFWFEVHISTLNAFDRKFFI